MNLITLILAIAILFGLTDFLTERYPRLQRDIYYIALLVISFLFTIKYYYGADIDTYVPYYEEMPTLAQLFAHPSDIPEKFELGYAFFCSALKSLGLSFYWMTAIVSIAYFLTIAMLFRRIERKRSFALAILVVLDYNCIFATYRQCLAVTCFIWMVLCLQNKKYLWAVVTAILAASFHKSGGFVAAIVLFYYVVSENRVRSSLYQILFVLLIIVFILPIAKISSGFVEHLPIPTSYADSLDHHLMLGKQIQVVFIIYAITLLLVLHFTQHRLAKKDSIAVAAIVGLVCVVVMYQYYYLLWRIRSYFLPIVLVYVFTIVQKAEDEQRRVPYGALLKQLSCVVVFLFLTYTTFSFHRNSLSNKYRIYTACTVFDLRNHRASDIRNSQLKQARLWWEEDFMKGEQNKLKR